VGRPRQRLPPDVFQPQPSRDSVDATGALGREGLTVSRCA
jgi:hypothetical protein